MGTSAERVWAAVLAGGRSARMGEDKSALVLDGRTLLERMLAVLDGIFPRVAVVLAAGAPVPTRLQGREVLHDSTRGEGPLAGLAAALAWCDVDHVFLTACDMPFPDEALVRLIAGAPEAPTVMPEWGGRIHPLHARYARTMETRVAEALAAGRRRMTELGEGGLVLPEAELAGHGFDAALALMNVNTPGELASARHLARDRSRTGLGHVDDR